MVCIEKIESVHQLELRHYSDHEIRKLGKVVRKDDKLSYPYDKPDGLWVSVDTFEESWPWWCMEEKFQLDALVYPHEVRLRADAHVLWLRSAIALDEFGAEYEGAVPPHMPTSFRGIDWRRVEEDYQGIIIAPYLWSRRLHHGFSWYYGWDCASGCIWDLAAIDKFRYIKPFG